MEAAVASMVDLDIRRRIWIPPNGTTVLGDSG